MCCAWDAKAVLCNYILPDSCTVILLYVISPTVE